MKSKIVSIVISAFNEEQNIFPLYAQLTEMIQSVPDIIFEILFVDDGSTDATYPHCLRLQEQDTSVKIVHLRRNFGHEIAMIAGMNYARGHAIIFMDADLQHPPQYIPQMIQLWQQGNDIVLTRRVDNLETSRFHKFCTSFFYKVLNAISETHVMENAPDFRLLDRKYIKVLSKFYEPDGLFRGILSFVMPNDRVAVIDFVAPARTFGHSKYTFKNFAHLAISGICQHSTAPLKLPFYVGIIGLFLWIISLFYLGISFCFQNKLPSMSIFFGFVLFLGLCFQFICLGILGLYIARMHVVVKRRPLYIADYIVSGRSKKHVRFSSLKKQG